MNSLLTITPHLPNRVCEKFQHPATHGILEALCHALCYPHVATAKDTREIHIKFIQMIGGTWFHREAEAEVRSVLVRDASKARGHQDIETSKPKTELFMLVDGLLEAGEHNT